MLEDEAIEHGPGDPLVVGVEPGYGFKLIPQLLVRPSLVTLEQWRIQGE
jgi:hypothetical protein